MVVVWELIVAPGLFKGVAKAEERIRSKKKLPLGVEKKFPLGVEGIEARIRRIAWQREPDFAPRIRNQWIFGPQALRILAQGQEQERARRIMRGEMCFHEEGEGQEGYDEDGIPPFPDVAL